MHLLLKDYTGQTRHEMKMIPAVRLPDLFAPGCFWYAYSATLYDGPRTRLVSMFFKSIDLSNDSILTETDQASLVAYSPVAAAESFPSSWPNESAAVEEASIQVSSESAA